MARLIDRDEHEHDHLIALRDIDVRVIAWMLDKMRVHGVSLEYVGPDADGQPMVNSRDLPRPLFTPGEAEAFKSFVDTIRAADEIRRTEE